MTTEREPHRWRQYGEDEVACRDCGTEPWHRDASEPCEARRDD